MNRAQRGTWKSESDDFVRAFCGAFLFGIPLLYTMEMWWIGSYDDMWKLLIFLSVAFLACLGLTYFAGFQSEKAAWPNVDQAIDTLAIGLIGSAIILLILNRIGLADPLDSIIGKVIIEAVPLSIGAAVGNAFFSSGRASGVEKGEEQEGRVGRAALRDMGATAAGAIFVAFSVAPTQEIPILAVELGYRHKLALIALSLVVSYAIVFESGFDPRRSGRKQLGVLQRPINQTLVAYAVPLLVALYLFDRVETGNPISDVVSQTLVLGLPATVGGAAGRLAV